MERSHNWTTGEWVRADAAHHLHPFCDVSSIKTDGAKVITDADGVYVTDSDGKRYLDGMAALWCTNVGYGRKELADAAYRTNGPDAVLQHIFQFHDDAGR